MKITTIVLLFLAFPMFSFETGMACKSEEKPVTVASSYEEEIRAVLNEENVDPYVTELLIAQSKLESGNYKNNLTRYNNVFARHYSKLDTFAISAGAKAEGHSRFAIYPSIKHATLSQLGYLKRKKYTFKWKSPYQFALELKKKHYYEAPIEKYIAGLSRYMK